MEQSIFDFKVKNNQNKEVDFSQFKGKVLLIVNTASKCGFTPQYKELEELYQKYKEQGLVIIGFPCNQFGQQEPSSDSEIASFCELNYGVTFPLMSKTIVNGKDTTPIYKFLKTKAGGFLFPKIKWNFTKFLIGRNGTTVKRYSPLAKPASFESDIIQFLSN